MDEEVLAAAAEGADGRAGEGGELAGPHALAEARLANLDAEDALAPQMGFEAAAQHLDLGQLGHTEILGQAGRRDGGGKA